MNDELTQAMIADGMARAEKAACAPGDSRCYAFPDPLEDARASCMPVETGHQTPLPEPDRGTSAG